MKNKLLVFFVIFLLNSVVKAENLVIVSKNISIDKKNELSVFEGDVEITTSENKKIKSDYAEYNKKKGIIVLKDNIVATDINMKGKSKICRI